MLVDAVYVQVLTCTSNLNLCRVVLSGITPIGQGWTNARGLRGLRAPMPDPKFFLYILIFQVLGVSHLFYFCERPLRISSLFLCLMVILVGTIYYY